MSIFKRKWEGNGYPFQRTFNWCNQFFPGCGCVEKIGRVGNSKLYNRSFFRVRVQSMDCRLLYRGRSIFIGYCFKEALEKINVKKHISLQIFATDLDNDAIEIARKGVFPLNISNDISAAYLKRYFTKIDEGFRIKNEIREMIVFAKHNIIKDPPFTKIDIVCCRNLLIYLEPELQQKILGLFSYSLNPDGLMILGSSESLGKQTQLFKSGDNKLKIYKRSSYASIPELFTFPSSFTLGRVRIILRNL